MSVISNPNSWLAAYQGIKAQQLKRELKSEGGLEGMLQKRQSAANTAFKKEMSGYDEALKGYEDMASQGLPEETLNLLTELNKQANLTSQVQSETLGEATRNVGVSNTSLLSAYKQIASMDAQQRIQNQQQYLSAKDVYAGRKANVANKELQFSLDAIEQPFYAKTAEMQALTGASLQNLQIARQEEQAKKDQLLQMALAITGIPTSGTSNNSSYKSNSSSGGVDTGNWDTSNLG